MAFNAFEVTVASVVQCCDSARIGRADNPYKPSLTHGFQIPHQKCCGPPRQRSEFQFIGTNRVVHTQVVQSCEPYQERYLATWPSRQAASCGTWRRKVKRMMNQK
jgi:hypothetical protein